jgi:hypothetical protein
MTQAATTPATPDWYEDDTYANEACKRNGHDLVPNVMARKRSVYYCTRCGSSFEVNKIRSN